MHSMVRSIPVLIVFSVLAGVSALRGGEIEAINAARIEGKIIIDGQLGDKMIEVRLETRSENLIATAVTTGSHEFSFQVSDFRPEENYFLVIKNPDYKELRYEMDINNFRRQLVKTEMIVTSNPMSQDYRSWYFYTYANMAILNLESLPVMDGSTKQIAGSKTVDIKQFGVEVPKEAKREYDMAMEGLALNDNQTARVHLEKAVQIEPKYFDAIRQLGLEYLKAGQTEKSEPLLIQAYNLNPKDPVTLTNLGTLYFQNGEKQASGTPGGNAGDAFHQAVLFLEQALTIDASAPQTNFYLGTALYRIGEYEKAESLLLRTMELDARMQEARLSLLNIYLRQKRYDAALEQIYAYLEAKPEAPERKRLEEMIIKIEGATGE